MQREQPAIVPRMPWPQQRCGDDRSGLDPQLGGAWCHLCRHMSLEWGVRGTTRKFKRFAARSGGGDDGHRPFGDCPGHLRPHAPVCKPDG